jgi:hypothetical protein
MVNVMFIRFVSGEIDPYSHVSAGFFAAAHELLEETPLADEEYDALDDLLTWFDVYLRTPFHYRLRAAWRAGRAICWFKPTAHDHLARAWAVKGILERNDVLIWTIKAQRIGYVLYEDEAQVFAEPFADIRRFL